MTLNLTGRVLPKFPARVASGVGALVTKLNGIWTFAFDTTTIPPGNASDPVNTDVIVEMPDGTAAKVPLSVALAGQSPEETGKKNALINGSFQIWQRGTSIVPVAATRTYCPDRWAVKTAAGTLTSVVRGGAGFGNIRAPNSIVLNGNAGVTVVEIDQRIEATQFSCLRAGGAPAVFSCRILNNALGAFTPTLIVECPTATDNWAVSNVRATKPMQSIPSAALQIVTASFDADEILGYVDSDKGISVKIQIPSGFLDSNTKSIRIYEAQFEPVPTFGQSPSLFETEFISDELARCQRYYWKTFPYGTAPAQNGGVTGAIQFVQVVGAAAAQAGGFYVRHPVVMRTTPTMTFFNPSAANALARNETVGADTSANSAVSTADGGVGFQFTTAAGSAAGNRNSVHLTADAEL